MSTTYNFTHNECLYDYRSGFSAESKQLRQEQERVWKEEGGSLTLVHTRHLSPDMQSVNECITELSRLEDDWDGDDALAPTMPVISNMRLLVSHLDRCLYNARVQWQIPDCFATPTGGVELYWRKTGFHLSLLVEPEAPGETIVLDGDGVHLSVERRFDCVGAASYATSRLCDAASNTGR